MDEWGAVMQHRQEVYQREKAEEGLNKRLNQQDYHRELDLAVAQKREKAQVDAQQKNNEKDFMTRNLQDRANQDAQTLNNLNRQKTQFSEIARGLIDQKQHQTRDEKDRQLQEETALLQRDQNAAFQYQQNQLARKEATKEVLQANNELMNQEKQRQAAQEQQEKLQPVGLSPGHVGWGYQN